MYSASSSVGSAAIQIARAKGSQVIAISQGEHASQLRDLGADIVLDETGIDIVRSGESRYRGAGCDIGASYIGSGHLATVD